MGVDQLVAELLLVDEGKRLGRELITHSDYRGGDWVKLEVLGDTKTLLPEPVGTLGGTMCA